MLSFHRPARAWIDNPAELAGMAHTYQPRFFSDIGYCSDSRGGWHHGPPLDHDAVKAGRALQLLTHPIWWVAEGRSPRERLSDFLARRHADMTRDLEANVVVPPDANNE